MQDRWNSSLTAKITLLEDKYEADTAIGTFEKNHDMDATINEGSVLISDVKINGATTGDCKFKYDLDLKYIGEEVKVLYRDGKDGENNKLDEKDTIYGVYVTGTTTVYNITKNDMQADDGTKIKFNNNKYSIASSVDVYTNYDATSTAQTTASGLTTALKAQSVDTIKFVCNDKGEIAKAYVVEYNVARVTGLSSSKITLSGVGAIDIADNNIYSGVAKDDVVVYTSFYDNDDKDAAFFTLTKAETVEGKLNGYKIGSGSDAGKFMNIVVDDTTYDFNKPVTTLPDVSDDSLGDLENDASIGDTVRVYMVNGMAAAVDSIESSGGNYAVITDFDTDGTLGSTLNGWKISVLTSAGEEETYTVHKDSVSDGASTAVVVGDLVAGNLIEYSISGDKIKIKQVKAGAALDAAVDAVAGKAGVWDKTSKVLTYKDGTTKTAVAANDAILFTEVTTLSGNVDYYAYNLRDLASIDNTTTTGRTVSVILNSDGLVKAAYVELSQKPGTATSDTLYGIVSKYVGVRSIDNETYYQYTVDLSKSEQETVYVDVNNAIDVGDLVKFDRNSNNLYAGGEFIKVTGSAAETTIINTWYIAAANRYSNNTLSYFTGTQHASADEAFVGTTNSGADETALNITVASDVKLVYVDVEENEAGEDIGVGHFNTNSNAGGANIIFHTNDDGIVDVIFVQTAETGSFANDTTVFGKTAP